MRPQRPTRLSRPALRQIVVGVEGLRIILGLGFQTAVLDHQIDRVLHVLVGDLERALTFGFRGGVERDGQFETLSQGIDLAALRIRIEDRLGGRRLDPA